MKGVDQPDGPLSTYRIWALHQDRSEILTHARGHSEGHALTVIARSGVLSRGVVPRLRAVLVPSSGERRTRLDVEER